MNKMIFGASTLAFLHKQNCTWEKVVGATEKITSLNLGVEIWTSQHHAGLILSGADYSVFQSAAADAPFISMHTQLDRWDRHALHKEIDQCAALGVTTLVLHNVTLNCHHSSFKPDYPEIVRLAEIARVYGLRLAIENSKDDLWFLDQILDRIGDDPQKTNIGVCIDIGHAYMSTDAGRQPVRAYLERYKDQLIHLHLHDNDGEEDLHQIPGEGTIDWRGVVETIDQIGYRGQAVIELHALDDPIVEIRRATRFFAHLISS